MQLEIIKHHLRRPARYEAKGCRFFRALLEGRKRAILQKQSARWGSMNQKTPDWMADAADRATPDRTPIRCAIEIGNGSCCIILTSMRRSHVLTAVITGYPNTAAQKSGSPAS